MLTNEVGARRKIWCSFFFRCGCNGNGVPPSSLTCSATYLPSPTTPPHLSGLMALFSPSPAKLTTPHQRRFASSFSWRLYPRSWNVSLPCASPFWSQQLAYSTPINAAPWLVLAPSTWGPPSSTTSGRTNVWARKFLPSFWTSSVDSTTSRPPPW